MVRFCEIWEPVSGNSYTVFLPYALVRSKFQILRSQASLQPCKRIKFWAVLWTLCIWKRPPLYYGAVVWGLFDISTGMQLLQSLFVYSLALFYGLLICLRLLWHTIRNFRIPPGPKKRETRKHILRALNFKKISWGSENFTYFWQCVSDLISLKCWLLGYTLQLLHAFSTLSLENTTS